MSLKVHGHEFFEFCFINLLLLSPRLLCFSHFDFFLKIVEIFESQVLSPVSSTPATNLSPVSLKPVINCRFTIVIDLDIVIGPENKCMTKDVGNGRQFIT